MYFVEFHIAINLNKTVFSKTIVYTLTVWFVYKAKKNYLSSFAREELGFETLVLRYEGGTPVQQWGERLTPNTKHFAHHRAEGRPSSELAGIHHVFVKVLPVR